MTVGNFKAAGVLLFLLAVWAGMAHDYRLLIVYTVVFVAFVLFLWQRKRGSS